MSSLRRPYELLRKFVGMQRRTWKEAAEMVLKDVRLFSSFCIAQFIVWRTLRRNSVLVNNAREKLNAEVRDAAALNRPDSGFSVHPISNS